MKRNVIEGLAYSGDDLMGKSIGRRAVAARAGDSELADGPSSTDDNVAIGNLAWRFNANSFPEKMISMPHWENCIFPGKRLHARSGAGWKFRH